MLLNRIKEIKILMLQGKISYDYAKELAMPVIDEMNVRASKIAKEFGKRHIPFTFSKLFR